VHHRTIQINHQPDATIFQFIILTFVYSSTCFGRFPAHHQELNNCSGSLLFYLRIVVTVVLLVVVGPAGRRWWIRASWYDYGSNQQDATIPSKLYEFWVMFLPIIRSTWLYLQYLVLLTQVAAGWCHGWVEKQFQLIHDTSRQLLGWILPDTVNTIKCSWWWAKTSPETCRAD
jgi:hypothetical protein